MTMEAVEFIRTLQKLCTGSKCYDCPLEEKGRCIIIHAVNPEESVRIVEEWAKEHPEEAEQEQQKPERERQKPEQKRQNPEQERKKAELHDKTYALREKVDHTPTKEASQTPEQKRTNKDVLLAAFPRMVMDGDVPVLCPRTMDRDIHIQHCAVRSCDQCRHEYWLSEVEK